MNYLTIVMYHYVRPILNSAFPKIKGLEFEAFKRQLDYLQDNYSIITSEEVINAVLRGVKLPENACWLTFDDGYKDHFQYVLPELISRNLSAAFFPPKIAVMHSGMLDVNSIHFILSSCNSIVELEENLDTLCIEHGIAKSQIKIFKKQHRINNRFDDAGTIYIKRMLQHLLPEKIRNSIVTNLFAKYVGVSQSEFATNLYMNQEEVKELIQKGMYVGSHGSMHYWLNQMSKKDQYKDISESLQFLEEVGARTSDWIMCYPYGAYNNDTLSLMKEFGAVVGVTTEFRKANLSLDHSLLLPRLDTNDFPQ